MLISYLSVKKYRSIIYGCFNVFVSLTNIKKNDINTNQTE